MRYIIVIVVTTVAISAVFCLFRVMARRRSHVAPDMDPKVIKQPVLYLYIGLFSTLFCFVFDIPFVRFRMFVDSDPSSQLENRDTGRRFPIPKHLRDQKYLSIRRNRRSVYEQYDPI